MQIRGGKGSGKTHLMRYFSYPLQRLRHGTEFVRGIQEEGYLGVYHRCGGLNAQRFRGKRQLAEVWDSVFSYYMELWLAQLLLGCVAEFSSDAGDSQQSQLSCVSRCVALLDDVESLGEPKTFAELASGLHALQRELDIEINNCALTGVLNIRIRATAGRLVFGFPKTLVSSLPSMQNVQVLYLIDEFENLTETQQCYVNTVAREGASLHI
jgi:hypothetical protein